MSVKFQSNITKNNVIVYYNSDEIWIFINKIPVLKFFGFKIVTYQNNILPILIIQSSGQGCQPGRPLRRSWRSFRISSGKGIICSFAAVYAAFDDRGGLFPKRAERSEPAERIVS
jgi:hypothetical protein